jgi:hypothetical protein
MKWKNGDWVIPLEFVITLRDNAKAGQVITDSGILKKYDQIFNRKQHSKTEKSFAAFDGALAVFS